MPRASREIRLATVRFTILAGPVALRAKARPFLLRSVKSFSMRLIPTTMPASVVFLSLDVSRVCWPM